MGIGEFSKPASGAGYWRTFKERIAGEVGFMLNTGTYVTLDKNSFADVNNVSGLEQFRKGNTKIYELPLKGGGTVKLGEIHKVNVKDGETRKPYNQGDVAEGVLAAAMVARFRSKNERIQIKHVFSVLNELKKTWGGGTTVEKTFLSKNKPQPKLREKLFDEVTVSIKLAQANMDVLLSLSQSLRYLIANFEECAPGM